jgi:hypothetical protein
MRNNRLFALNVFSVYFNNRLLGVSVDKRSERLLLCVADKMKQETFPSVDEHDFPNTHGQQHPHNNNMWYFNVIPCATFFTNQIH